MALRFLPVDPSAGVRRPRAAIYLRMSTDMQQYSLEAQTKFLEAFAEREGLTITQTYTDPGRSGLTLRGRPALQALLADIERGADFEFLLIYDVSRWGRFQDVDESAYYEYRCRQRGVKVVYCAEPFENDGSAIGAVFKSIKRVMAGEFSRELSAKIFSAQLGLSEKGYWQGAPAGFGMVREVVTNCGASKGVLLPGEQKFLRQDRVRLAPGNEDEVETVRLIFRLYTEDGLDRAAIARRLNAEGVPRRITPVAGRTRAVDQWNPGAIRTILLNAKYAGHYVYNRRCQKLGSRVRSTLPEEWVVVKDIFTPIIDQTVFDLAQRICLARRFSLMTDEQLLERLRVLLQRHGKLNCEIVTADCETPSVAAYAIRFGGLLKAYELIGWRPDRDWTALAAKNVETGRRRKEWLCVVRAAVAAGTPAPPFESNSVRVLKRQAAREARAARKALRLDVAVLH
jgi:DNA invertase Pin-like site-specific DNA recombinase